MSSATVFTKSVLQTKKSSRAKLLFLVLERIIKNNFKLFFFCSLLGVITAVVNYNIGTNIRDAFFTREKSLTAQVINRIEKEGKRNKKEIEKKRIREILEEEFKKNDEKQEDQKDLKAKVEKKVTGEGEMTKKEVKELILKSGKGFRTVWNEKNFKFKFNFFGWKWKKKSLCIKEFILWIFGIIFVVKSTFSLLHFYLMSYSYDSVEKDLKKDFFRHFIRAKFPNSSEISRNLITQFASDLDTIARNIWFIPNRLIYMGTTIIYYIIFDFSFGSAGTNWKFIGILFSLFVLLIVVEIILFKKADKLNVAAKKRYEEDNKIIYERINNLEYIKIVSGEGYEEEKINKQLTSTFQKNKNSLLYSVLFKAVPSYVVIPNIPIVFVASTLTLASSAERNDPAFFLTNFVRYFFTVRSLNNEVNKIIDSMLTLDELSSTLTIVNESAKTLNQGIIASSSVSPVKNATFENGDIIFQNVVFAYPKRPHQNILQNFSFRFVQGKIYGIAGKNGIGKSTITKTTLKLYEIKEGQILINKHNIQEIDTISLHQRICYQTNRPTFFQMSIAENVYYPNNYKKDDYKKLVQAAEKVGIYEFITKLPQGFDTILREGGADLSEGQKQQITAMRVFINDYDIYILDEILSNVHPILKGTVLQNIFTKLKGKTVLVIDHHYEIFRYVNYVYQFTGKELIEIKKENLVD